jgi:hypothetical protein
MSDSGQVSGECVKSRNGYSSMAVMDRGSAKKKAGKGPPVMPRRT